MFDRISHFVWSAGVMMLTGILIHGGENVSIPLTGWWHFCSPASRIQTIAEKDGTLKIRYRFGKEKIVYAGAGFDLRYGLSQGVVPQLADTGG
ncbi:MAG: hypothetical protein D6820_17830, partial [Lentisphaerae bacterium]